MISSKVSPDAQNGTSYIYGCSANQGILTLDHGVLSWSRYLPKASIQANGVDLPIQTSTIVQKDRASKHSS